MTKIGLALFDKSAHWVLDNLLDEENEWVVYAYHPDLKEEDTSVLFSTEKSGLIRRWGPPFDWVVEQLREASTEGLDFVVLPSRRTCKTELSKIMAAELIGPNTAIWKGKKRLS